MKLSIASFTGNRIFMAVNPVDPASRDRERLRIHVRMLKDFTDYPLGQGTFSTYFHESTKLKINARAFLGSALQSIGDRAGPAVIKALVIAIRSKLQAMTEIDRKVLALAQGEIKTRVLRELGPNPLPQASSQYDLDNLIDRKIAERIPQDERFQVMEKELVEILNSFEQPLNELIARLEQYLK